MQLIYIQNYILKFNVCQCRVQFIKYAWSGDSEKATFTQNKAAIMIVLDFTFEVPSFGELIFNDKSRVTPAIMCTKVIISHVRIM